MLFHDCLCTLFSFLFMEYFLRSPSLFNAVQMILKDCQSIASFRKTSTTYCIILFYNYIYLFILISAISLFFKRFYLFFRERGREGEREGEKHQCVAACHASLTGDLTHKPGMCPDWELNQQPLASQSSAQSIEPHQPWHKNCHLCMC